jgi:hypothetical protein
MNMFKYYVAAIGLVMCLGRMSWADTIVWSHTGTNNPVTEGWTQYTGGAGFTGIDGANDGSWEIGTTAAEYRTYDHTNDLTAAQLVEAETYGYKLEMVVKAQTGILPQPVRHEIGGQALLGGTLHVWSSIGFGSDESGNVLVGLIDGPGYNYGTTATVPGSGSAYHTYDLIFKPGNGKEDLYVDGSLLIADHTPASYPNTWGLENSYINFGANDGTATGTGWYKSVQFSVHPTNAAIPGDINGDNLVNLADYTILKGHWLQNIDTGVSGGDLNHDGIVNLLDFGAFKQDYNTFNGISGDAAALSLAVPEPGTLALMALATPLFLFVRRRRNGVN